MEELGGGVEWDGWQNVLMAILQMEWYYEHSELERKERQ